VPDYAVRKTGSLDGRERGGGHDSVSRAWPPVRCLSAADSRSAGVR
jgi:hypothetical protein